MLDQEKLVFERYEIVSVQITSSSSSTRMIAELNLHAKLSVGRKCFPHDISLFIRLNHNIIGITGNLKDCLNLILCHDIIKFSYASSDCYVISFERF